MTPPISSAFIAHPLEISSTPTRRPLPDLVATLQAYNTGLLSEELRHAKSTLDPSAALKILPNIVAFFPRVSRMGLTGNQNLYWGDELAEASARSQFEARKAAIEKLRSQLVLGGTNEGQALLRSTLETALCQLPPETQKLLIEELGIRQLHALFSESNGETRVEKMIAFAQNDRPQFLGYGSGNTRKGWLQDKWNLSGHRYNPYFARTLLHYIARDPAKRSPALSEPIKEKVQAILSESKGSGTMAGVNNLLARGITLALCTPVNLLTGGRYGKAETCITPHRKWADEDMQNIVGRGLLAALSLIGFQKAFKSFAPQVSVISGRVRFGRIETFQRALYETYNTPTMRGMLRMSSVAMTDTVIAERFIPEDHQLNTLDEKAEFERYPDPH